MKSAVQFPLFVFEKDDSSMFRVETLDKILYHLETIDIQNDEYLFWDVNGNSVQVSVKGNAISEVGYGEPRGQGTGLPTPTAMTLREAFERHAGAFALNIEIVGDPEDVWTRLETAQLPLRHGFLSRLFRSNHRPMLPSGLLLLQSNF